MRGDEDDRFEDARDHAEALFRNSSNCAEAVLSAVVNGAGLNVPEPWRMTTAFGGGMARRGLTCGALAGAAVALSAACGRRHAHDADGKEEVYTAMDRVLRAVEKRFGSVQCRTLTGLDFTLQADRDAFEERALDQVCAPVVRFVTAACLAEISDGAAG